MPYRTVEQIELLIGDKLRSYRLNRNLTQEDVAAKADIRVAVLQRLERGVPVKLGAFVRVVKALGLEDWFDTLAPVPAINPLHMVDEQPRQRARRKGGTHGQ